MSADDDKFWTLMDLGMYREALELAEDGLRRSEERIAELEVEMLSEGFSIDEILKD